MLASQIIKQTPVVGSVYGFYRTASRVYDSISPAGAVKETIKGLVVLLLLSSTQCSVRLY